MKWWCYRSSTEQMQQHHWKDWSENGTLTENMGTSSSLFCSQLLVLTQTLSEKATDASKVSQHKATDLINIETNRLSLTLTSIQPQNNNHS
jgi:hypothetical protein